jgi:hypothetical protein
LTFQVMSPEQRLTIREAIDLIAERGTAPITEAALRARIRARRVGVVRIGGRVYTNPLNLVTAGLLPVDALDGVSRVPRAEINDAELHAWLNPPGDETRPAEPPPASAPQDAKSRNADSDGEPPSERPSASSNDEVESGAAGPLERALGGSAAAEPFEVSPRSDGLSSCGSRPRAAEPGADTTTGPSEDQRRRGLHRRVGALAAAALVIGGFVVSGADRGGAGSVAEIRGTSLASVDGALDRSLLEAGDRASQRGDYDAAADFAAAAGDAEAADRWQRAAARIVLSRARRAASEGRVRQARQQLELARARYGNPLPARRRVVLASVSRAERAARQRADARRANDRVRAAPVVVAAPAESATGTGGAGVSSTSSSASSSGSASRSGGSGARSSGSRSGAANGPGEFF